MEPSTHPISSALHKLLEDRKVLMITQNELDKDLATLVIGVDAYIAAAQAKIAAQAAALEQASVATDFSAEDAQLQKASSDLSTSLGVINPAAVIPVGSNQGTDTTGAAVGSPVTQAQAKLS